MNFLFAKFASAPRARQRSDPSSPLQDAMTNPSLHVECSRSSLCPRHSTALLRCWQSLPGHCPLHPASRGNTETALRWRPRGWCLFTRLPAAPVKHEEGTHKADARLSLRQIHCTNLVHVCALDKHQDAPTLDFASPSDVVSIVRDSHPQARHRLIERHRSQRRPSLNHSITSNAANARKLYVPEDQTRLGHARYNAAAQKSTCARGIALAHTRETPVNSIARCHAGVLLKASVRMSAACRVASTFTMSNRQLVDFSCNQRRLMR